MQITNQFKKNAAKMLAVGAFLFAGFAANAQQKPKADTVVTHKVVTPMKKTSEVTKGDSTIVNFQEKYRQKRKAEDKQVKTTPVKVEQVTPKKYTGPMMSDSAWRKFVKENPNWNKKKETTAPAPQKTVEKSTSEYNEDVIYVRDSTVVTIRPKPPAPDTIPVKIVPLKVKRPSRFIVGVGVDNPMGEKRDRNAPAVNIVNNIYDVDEGQANFVFAQYETPTFGAKGTFGSLVRAFARVELYENKELDFLIEDELLDGSLYDAKVSRSKLRNNAKAGLKFGPSINLFNGHLKINPQIAGGVKLQEKADVRVVEFPGFPTYQLGPSQQKTLQNTASAFYEGAIDIYADFGKPKTKNNVQTDRGFFLHASGKIGKDTRTDALHNVSNGTALYAPQWRSNLSVGLGYRF